MLIPKIILYSPSGNIIAVSENPSNSYSCFIPLIPSTIISEVIFSTELKLRSANSGKTTLIKIGNKTFCPVDGDNTMLNLLYFFQAEDGIRYWSVTGVQTCALPI